MARIVYSSHAVSRMQERKITTDEIELILSKPEGKIRQSVDKWIFYRKFPKRPDNLLAAVVVEMSRGGWEVVTVLVNFEVLK